MDSKYQGVASISGTAQAEPERLNSVQEDLETVFSIMNDMHSIIDLLSNGGATDGSPTAISPNTVSGLSSALTISAGNLRERLQFIRNRIGVLG